MGENHSSNLDQSLTGRIVRAAVVIYAGLVIIAIPATFGGTLEAIRRFRKRKSNVRKRPERR